MVRWPTLLKSIPADVDVIISIPRILSFPSLWNNLIANCLCHSRIRGRYTFFHRSCFATKPNKDLISSEHGWQFMLPLSRFKIEILLARKKYYLVKAQPKSVLLCCVSGPCLLSLSLSPRNATLPTLLNTTMQYLETAVSAVNWSKLNWNKYSSKLEYLFQFPLHKKESEIY
jgi:hypothetical protein